MNDQSQTQLGKTLWAIADQLRGAMDVNDFRDMNCRFVKSRSDQFRGVTKLVPRSTYLQL